MLARILTPPRPGSYGPYYPPLVQPSQRDAEVAATLIQWLGTNVGRAFVDECEEHAFAEGERRRHRLAVKRRHAATLSATAVRLSPRSILLRPDAEPHCTMNP